MSYASKDNTNSNSTIPTVAESDENPDANEHQISRWRKIAYGLGGPPMQMATNCTGFFLVVFLLETAGLDPYYNSVIQFGARAWDAITDPIMGYLVSRTRTRFGRYRPWLLIAAPFCSLSFFFLFLVPNISSSGWKFTYYFIMVLIMQTAVTAFHVPYSSMTMVLTTNMKERDECSLYRMFFELSGVLLGVGVFGSIVGVYRIELAPDPLTNKTMIDLGESKKGYMMGSIFIAVIFALCALVAFFGTKEKTVVATREENYMKTLGKILRFKPYLLLMFAFLFLSLANQIIQGNLALYVTHSLKIPKHINTGIMTILVTAILLMPPLYLLMNRIGKKHTFRLGLLNMYPVMIAVMFVPENPPLWCFYLLLMWAGFTISVSYLVPWSMLPDVIDDFMMKTGLRKEAAFYSLYVFFNKLAVGASVGFSSIVIGAAGYETGSVSQPESVSVALRYLIGIATFICLTFSFVILYFYPLDQAYMDKLKKHLLTVGTDDRKFMDGDVNTEIMALDKESQSVKA